MKDTEQLRSTLLAAVVTLAAVGAVALGTGGVLATAGTPHSSSGNYTVALPNDIDHYPGDQNRANASIHHLAGLEGVYDGKGLEKASVLTIGNPAVDFSECTTSDTAAFGIDRGNDDSGTTTDEGLLRYRESSQFNEHGIVVDFYEGDEIGGSSVSIDVEDEIVAVQNTCYTMPSEPGWYQIQGNLNGTTYEGTHAEFELTSHYFYICECDSEAQAREKLGPPPSESSSDAGGSSTPAPTATATPRPDSTPTVAPQTETASASGSGSSGGSGGDGSDGQAATATPDLTATPAESGGSDGGAQTATARSQQTATAAAGGDDSSATATAASGGQSGSQQSQDAGTQQNPDQQAGIVTPTAGAGPGFGVLATLGGLLALGLLSRRR